MPSLTTESTIGPQPSFPHTQDELGESAMSASIASSPPSQQQEQQEQQHSPTTQPQSSSESASPTEPLDLQGQLRNQLNEVSQMAGGLAHEIRNPISTMLLTLDLLSEEFRKPENPREERIQKRIERVRREAQRLQQILEDFLRLARLQNMDFEAVDLNSVIDDIRDFYEPQAALHEVVLRVHYDETLPLTLLDVNLFKQALLNLLLNAQQAMPQGGELILTTRREGSWNVLDVIDTGIGISSETQAKVFDPFYSTKPGGHGLGLPMVRRIIECHGGSVQLRSELGKGSQFALRLRQADPAPSSLAAR